jgi:murein DD-endopeptidase MepM/ murein hydrolase activator NlpD/beta-lactamase regulating signal transducer with metallopeptidase domain
VIADLARSPTVLALGAALLHSVWQIAAIALVLAAVLRGLPRARADLRHAAACAALLAAALLPVATFVHLCLRRPPALSVEALAALAAGAPPSQPPSPSPSAQALAGLSLVWALGVLFTATRFARGLLRLRELVRSGTEPLPPALRSKFAELARALGLARVPRLLGSLRVDVPMALGFLRPAVLVPLSILSALPRASVEALLAHELAHLKRLDFAVNLVMTAVETVLFYHPAVRWMARCVRTEREHAADDVAARLFGATPYARALFELESSRATGLASAPELALGSNGGSLMMRIKRLVAEPAPARGAHGSSASLVVALGLMCSVAVTLEACASAPAPETAHATDEAAAELRIRWLPPALAPYRGVFEQAAARHGVDADTLAIVALVESSGDPAAESPMGAVGLMQLMPRTAANIAAERGLADFKQDRLRDPATNVDFGAWYLARQLDAFGEPDAERSIELASAAYNAGPQAVRAWLDGAKPLPEEAEKYAALVAGMWSERDSDRSETFSAWRERVRTRAATKASPPVSAGAVSLAYGADWQGRAHEGVDIVHPQGTPISAPLDGTVVKASADGDHGNVVVVRHRGGLETRYHHLGSIAVREGQRVTKNTAIGEVGSTGKSTGPHLHFEVRDLGTPIDPTPYLRGVDSKDAARP